MELIFVSNYLNHHSEPLCREFLKNVDKFSFVATMNTEGIGYAAALEADYVLDYTDSARQKEIEERICNADCVIFGDCPNKLIKLRMAENKLSFLYSERFFKKGSWRRFIPKVHKNLMERIGNYANKKMYTLCASAYLPKDLLLLGYPTDKCFRWGYFPHVERYAQDDILAEKRAHTKVVIFWAARLIPLKHPEILISLAEKLNAEAFEYELHIAGSGSEENKILSELEKNGLLNKVKMLGTLTPEETRAQMLRSDIFLFTSDYHEGWGAVVNEAMNAGCAVVACEAAGSVPFLIQDGINGFSYAYGDKKKLHNCVKKLIMNRDLRLEMGMNAHKTISVLWNAENAAGKFLKLANGLLNGEQVNISDGPGSRA